MFNVIGFVLVDFVNISLGMKPQKKPLLNDNISTNPVSRLLVFSLNPSDIWAWYELRMRADQRCDWSCSKNI
jgi:hypothetical protein